MILLHFDGLCHRNPGGVGTYGFVVHEDGRKIHEGWGLVALRCTNNIAEYTALVRGLEYLVERSRTADPVLVRGDSELVIRQMNGEYRVKSPHLAPLFARARELSVRFTSLRFEHVPREQNAEADALTNRAFREFRARPR
jgi:ribonuclease HI